MDHEVLQEVHAKREAGFNCAEGVFWGVTRSIGLDIPASCVTGFGGGIAGSGSVCGALCGAIAAVGIYVGRTEPEDNLAKARCNDLCDAINLGFVDEMGTQFCKEILGYMPGSKPKDSNQGISPKCKQAVTVAMELTLRVIAKDQQKKRSGCT